MHTETTPPDAADAAADTAPTRGVSEDDKLDLTKVASWDGDRLVLHESALEKVIRHKLSPSTSKSIGGGCGARWVAERLMPEKFDPFTAANLGSSVHEIFEEFFELPYWNRSRSTALGLLEKAKAAMWPGNDDITVAKRAEWHGKVYHLMDGLWKIEEPMQVRVHAVEQGFGDEVLVAGVPFVGYVDRTDVTEAKDGTVGLAVVDYKGLALDTPIPTPTGWTTMGALEVGDQVLGTSGSPVNVTIKSQIHNRPCYELTFSDGSTVVCDNVHYWQVTESNDGATESAVLEADALHERYLSLTAEGRTASLTIPNARALDLPDADLGIDPYVLGAWLGDGTSKSGEITVGDADVDDMMVLLKGAWAGEVRLYEHGDRAASISLLRPYADACPYGHRDFTERGDGAGRRCRECGRNYDRGVSSEATNVSLTNLLRAAGLIRNKHVPGEYLRGSHDQRLALLRGLMDTDGHWNSTRNRAIFVTTNELLADAVAELVATFGLNAQRFAKPYENAARPDAVAYTVEFSAVGINPFGLPRKAAAVDAHLSEQSNRKVIAATRRTITKMIPVDSVPTQCIQVDAADSLYLCGPTMVVTHNTGKQPDPNKIKRYGDDHGDQMRLYNEAYFQETGERPVRASLYYTQFGKKKDAALSAPYMKKTLTAFEQSWTTLKRYEADQAYPTQVGPLCGWCPLVNTCPVAAAAGKEDRTGKALPQGNFKIPVMRALRAEVAVSGVELAPDYVPYDPYDPYDDTEIPAAATDPVHEQSTSAHISSAESALSDPSIQQADSFTGLDHLTSTSIGEHMSILFSEDKPYFDEAQGLLNANAYASTAVFGVTSWAYDELCKAGIPLSRDALDGLARTLQYVIATVQHELGGSTRFSDGLNTRLRGALHTFMDHNPLPFGADAATWEAWVNKAIKNIRTIAKTSHSLYTEAGAAQPWLAVAAPASPQAVAG